MDLVPLFIPSLLELLRQAESSKGTALTENEVYRIRDSATTVMVSEDVFNDTTLTRGFADIDPRDCWQEWKNARTN